MSEDTNRPRIIMDVCRDGWTRGLQLGIAALDESGCGDGYRIAGPKYNGSQELLLSADLDERDAAEIRGYLDRAFPVGDDAEQQENVRQYGLWLVEIRDALGAESWPQLPGLVREMRAELIEARAEIERLRARVDEVVAQRDDLLVEDALAERRRDERGELPARVQCDDCGAVGDVAVSTDGRRHLTPSGEIGYPVAQIAAKQGKTGGAA